MYKDELEELHRYTIWQKSKAQVEEHNCHADGYGYTLEMNKFSDMESHEITQVMDISETVTLPCKEIPYSMIRQQI